MLGFLALLLAAPQDPWPPAPPLEIAEVARPAALPASVTAEARPDGRWSCTFTYEPQDEVQSVSLAGSFNGWSTTATPLARGRDGTWSARVEVDGGHCHYKFVVDGHRWLADPRNAEGVDDGFGGRNSLLRLGADAALDGSAAERGDGRIAGSALAHRPASPLFLQRLGDRWQLRYRTLAHDVEGVTLAQRDAGETAMGLALSTDIYDYWETSVEHLGSPYTFVLVDGDLRVSHPRTYGLDPADADTFATPEWAKDAVWYQVLLDRFRNGDPSNDPDPVRPWTSEWFEPSEFEGRDGQGFYTYYVFRRHYGGDLQGLRQGLDYLADLGVNALYLNPVFQARSHHKYDATNYLHVDEHFGFKGDYAEAEAAEDLLDPSTWTWTKTDRLFLDFLREAHDRGLRVIVDGVFNHVGVHHPAFRDVREKGERSRFADWFDVRSWKPFRYEGWAGYGELPVFKKTTDGLASEAVKQHVFAETRRWMDPDGDGDPSDGVDGWRLDVPNEIAMPFWAEWRDLVKSINPDAYITGEIWDRADAWLDGRHFDAVMNYPFAEIALAWIGDRDRKITASECDRRFAELRFAYPAEATYALMNLADSHDTDRLVSMLKNPDREYDEGNRVQDGADYDEDRPGPKEFARARLIALLQMTYVGAPMVYYGDEVGMWGADDPSNRKPMLWKDLEPYAKPKENFVLEPHLAHYRRAIGLRRAHPALRTGSFRTLLTDDRRDVWVFLREGSGERVVVALNASTRAARLRIDELEGDWTSEYGDAGADRGASVRIPALDGRVWVSRP